MIVAARSTTAINTPKQLYEPWTTESRVVDPSTSHRLRSPNGLESNGRRVYG